MGMPDGVRGDLAHGDTEVDDTCIGQAGFPGMSFCQGAYLRQVIRVKEGHVRLSPREIAVCPARNGQAVRGTWGRRGRDGSGTDHSRAGYARASLVTPRQTLYRGMPPAPAVA